MTAELRPALIFLLMAVATGLGACAKKSEPTPEATILRSYLEAFNRHDPNAVAALLAPAVKWFSVDSERLIAEGDGREALRAWLTRYFNSQPDVRAEFLSLEQTGILVAVRERVTWTDANQARRRQQSHAVYQVRNGLITHVWYFPAAREPGGE